MKLNEPGKQKVKYLATDEVRNITVCSWNTGIDRARHGSKLSNNEEIV